MIINLIESQLDMLKRRFRPQILLFILVPFILLAPVWLTGKAMFWGTPILQFVPWRAWAWETIRSGHLPLWNPLVGMGAPLIANYQSGLFYPPNWLFFILAEIGGTPLLAWGQAILVAAHMAWAALGMGFLARRLGLHELAQMISGLSFGLGGYLVARSGFLSINAAVAWLPWVILGVTRLVEAWGGGSAGRASGWGGRMHAVLLLSLALGMQFLAGHAQTAWYTLLLAGLWGGFLVLTEQRIGRGSFDGLRTGFRGITRINRFPIRGIRVHPRPMLSSGLSRSRVKGLDGVRRLSWIWIGIGLAVLLGAGLAAVQIFPTGEYLIQSQRSSQVDYEMGLTYSFWPWRFLTLIAPDLFGSPVKGDYWGYANYWEDAVYIGLLPLLLALGAIVRGFGKGRAIRFHTKIIRFLLPVLIASFILALGTNTPIFPWLYFHVPTFDMFQAPSRFSLWAVFCLCLLAGIGAEYWQRPMGRGLYWTRLGTAGALAVALGAGLAWLYMGDIRPTFIRATALAGFWGVGAGVLSLLAPERRMGMQKPRMGMQGLQESGGVRGPKGGDSAAWGCGDYRGEGGRGGEQGGGAGEDSVAWGSGDYRGEEGMGGEQGEGAGGDSAEWGCGDYRGERKAVFWRWVVGLMVAADLMVAGWGLNPGIDMHIYEGISQTAAQMASLTDGGRVYLPEDDEYRLKFDRFFRFDTFQPEGGWTGLRAALLPNTNMLDNLPSANNFDPLLPERYSQWIESLNEASPETQRRLLNLMGVEVVERVGDSQPYEIKLEKQEASPRFRWVPCGLAAQNGEDALDRVMHPDIDFEREVILETHETSSFPNCQEMGESSVEVTSSNPNRITLQVQADSPGYLFAADVWYPGWRAQVDGDLTQIYKANYLFRAVNVPAGRHEVTFVYRPIWFIVGALASLVLWAGTGIFFVWHRVSRV